MKRPGMAYAQSGLDALALTPVTIVIVANTVIIIITIITNQRLVFFGRGRGWCRRPHSWRGGQRTRSG
jgi:hypothetical protein